jgi:hypothetical protein
MGSATNQKKRTTRNHILRQQDFMCANESCRKTLTYETANLYHKRSRFDPDRRSSSHGKHVYQVMCRPCCDKLSAAKEARQPIELLHFNAKRHPTDEYYFIPQDCSSTVELAAHNGLVGGSTPPGPTNPSATRVPRTVSDRSVRTTAPVTK